MEIKHIVEIIITDMEAGHITGFILDGKQYGKTNKQETATIEKQTIKINTPKKRSHNIIDTWLDNKPKLISFSINDFFKDQPEQKLQRQRTEKYLTKMIDDNTIKQTNKDSFVVTTRFVESRQKDDKK